jgi:predicted ester cyclase
MSSSENKEFVRKYFTIDGRTEAGLKQYLEAHDPEYVTHSIMGDMNLAQAKQTNLVMLAAFPDLKFNIEDIFAEGDKVVVRYTMAGTNQGSYMGAPPTGKKISLNGISIYKITGGRLVESWGVFDRLSLMQQLGTKSQK